MTEELAEKVTAKSARWCSVSAELAEVVSELQELKAKRVEMKEALAKKRKYVGKLPAKRAAAVEAGDEEMQAKIDEYEKITNAEAEAMTEQLAANKKAQKAAVELYEAVASEDHRSLSLDQFFTRDEQDAVCEHLQWNELQNVAALSCGWMAAARYRQVAISLKLCKDVVPKLQDFFACVRQRSASDLASYDNRRASVRSLRVAYEQGLNGILEARDERHEECCEACCEMMSHLRSKRVRGIFLVIAPTAQHKHWRQALCEHGHARVLTRWDSRLKFPYDFSDLDENAVIIVESNAASMQALRMFCDATAKLRGGALRPLKYVAFDHISDVDGRDDAAGQVERRCRASHGLIPRRWLGRETSCVLLRLALPPFLSANKSRHWPRSCEQLRWCLSLYSVTLPECAKILHVAMVQTLASRDAAEAAHLTRNVERLTTHLHASLTLCVCEVDEVDELSRLADGTCAAEELGRQPSFVSRLVGPRLAIVTCLVPVAVAVGLFYFRRPAAL